MTMKGFQGIRMSSAVEARTVGDLLGKKDVSIGYIPGGILDEYNGFVDDNYAGNEVLKKFQKNKTGGLLGSSSFMTVGMNEFLQKHYSDMQSAILSELDEGRKYGLDTNGRYIDTAFVLKDLNEPNPYHARKIGEQTPADIELPVIYWLRDTKLEIDKKAPEGLSFIINPKKAFSAPSMKEDCDFDSLGENGMPIPNQNGKRHSYTAKNGLRRVYLYWRSYVCSSVAYLASSISAGGEIAITKPE